MSAGLLLSTFPHSSLPDAVAQRGFFFPFLKYAITEAQPTSLIGSALESGGSLSEMPKTGYAAAMLDCQCRGGGVSLP